MAIAADDEWRLESEGQNLPQIAIADGLDDLRRMVSDGDDPGA